MKIKEIILKSIKCLSKLMTLENVRSFSKLTTQSYASIASYFVVITIVFLMNIRLSCLYPASSNWIENIAIFLGISLMFCCALDIAVRLNDTLKPKNRAAFIIFWLLVGFGIWMSQFTLITALDQLVSGNMTCEKLSIEAKYLK
ncbi:hypothetical protein [Yersinia enterocolitica]|uniref:hypothetical protein n=1 Tax=Yersinia enterocolitica TaxID=630 RepID=UPI0005E7D7CA|nr:hypothetical protein [Yersinia enterocolitica]CNF77935.1 Uncharacterised protein [Yersinia enterocolitica]CQD70833.1 Uncharacterised protein [Yersinia enterocolitica]CRX90828.1 Uncharacterised protein [Yersinia enterocolitica]